MKYSYGILYCLAFAPTVDGFGQDGIIILGVFIPVIVFVIVLFIIRACLEWTGMGYHSESDEGSNFNHNSYEPQPILDFQAPPFTGRVVLNDTVRDKPDTSFLDNSCLHPSSTRSQMLKRKIRQRKMKTKYRNEKQGRKSIPQTDVRINQSVQRSNKLRGTHHNHFRVERRRSHIMSSSIKSLDKELWVERKRDRRIDEIRKERRGVKRLQQRKKELKQMKNFANHTRRSSLQNNLRQPGYENYKMSASVHFRKCNNISGQTSKRTNTRPDRIQKRSVKRKSFQRNGSHTRQTLYPKISHDLSSTVRFRTSKRARKSCLKGNRIQRKPSKHVRFELNQALEDRYWNAPQCKRRNICNDVPSHDNSLVYQKNILRAETTMNNILVCSSHIKNSIPKAQNISAKSFKRSPIKQRPSIYATLFEDPPKNVESSFFPILNIGPQRDMYYDHNCRNNFIGLNQRRTKNTVNRPSHKTAQSSHISKSYVDRDMYSVKFNERDDFKICRRILSNDNIFPFTIVDPKDRNASQTKTVGFMPCYQNQPLGIRVFCTDQSSSILPPRGVFNFQEELNYTRPN